MRILLAILLMSGPAIADEARIAFNNHCRTCHSLAAGDHRLGPSLHGIFGRQAGGADGYAYSSALESAGFVWTEEKMDAFLAEPDTVLPGNNMNPYQGLTDPDLRAKLIEAMR